MQELDIYGHKPTLVLPIGPSGAGKSSLVRRLAEEDHQIVSSDDMRVMLSGDANNQRVTSHAFDMVHAVVTMRCRQECVTFVDATNLKPSNRRDLVADARTGHDGLRVIGIVVQADEQTCIERQDMRERSVPEHVIERHFDRLESSYGELPDEDYIDELWTYDSGTDEWSKGLTELPNRVED